MDERLLVRAAGPGRIRGIGLDLWAAAVARPAAAGRIFADGLREARALHSAERRLVQELLYGLLRSSRGLAHLVGGDDPLQLWHARLILEGLAPSPEWAWLPARWATFDADLPVAERLVLRHSWSPDLAARVADQLGDEALAYAAASDARAPTDLRVQRGTTEAAAARLRAEGVETASLAVPGGLRVEGRHNLVALAPYRDGTIEIQDEGSQRIAALVEPEGRVIDVCAGAGGKALAFAAAGAEVLALDVRPRALAELERRAERARVRVRTRVIPADRLPADLPRAERVVVDAPCSGTGVLRRHPEHRFVDAAGIAARAEVQRRLLAESAALVAPGGRLIYATCSVLREENEDVVASLAGWTVRRELRTWTHRDGCDGFYAAVLTRG